VDLRIRANLVASSLHGNRIGCRLGLLDGKGQDKTPSLDPMFAE
jgi:hypothetical protein